MVASTVPVIWPMGAELPKPHKLASLWDNDDYIAEVKIDGERLIVIFTSEGIRLFTRSGSKFAPDRPIEVTHRWPQIQSITWQDKIPTGTILDGEAFSKFRRAEEIAGLFNHRSDIAMPDDIRFIAFDCLKWGDTSLEEEPWLMRRGYTDHAIKLIDDSRFDITVCTHKFKKRFFDSIIAAGGEGVVLKYIYGKYYQGKKPANIWVKAKAEKEYDCIITGYKEANKGKYKGIIGSIRFSQYKLARVTEDRKDYVLVKVCYASGMSDELRKLISSRREDFLGSVAVVEAFGRNPKTLQLRHPRLKYIRPEGSKSPKECIIEEE